MQFLAWAALTLALLGVAVAFGFFLDWLDAAAERRDARRRARDVEFTPYRQRRSPW